MLNSSYMTTHNVEHTFIIIKMFSLFVSLYYNIK